MAPGKSGAMSNPYTEANRRRWNELVGYHLASPLYRVEEFKQGLNKLYPLDLEEVGEVTAKSLLHLQCHFGLDTLSWARLGATVTGFDFSGTAIKAARSLAQELGIPARFVLSTYERLPLDLDGTFDIVYMSRGVLCWLPNLAPLWAVVRRFVKPGGIYYLADSHPLVLTLDDAPDATEPRFLYPYFHRAEPDRAEVVNTYADPDAVVENTTEYFWNHSLADVVNGMIGAGLQVEFLHEFPYTFFPNLPGMVQGDDGYWRLPPPLDGRVPLMFSVRGLTPCPSPSSST
jgi:SAM-dependent methyltransferase